MFKKIICFISSVLIAFNSIAIIAKNNANNNNYMRYAVAINSNTLLTIDGEKWQIIGDLETDSIYKVIFFNNGTNTIYDDIIINVKKYN